MRRICILGTGPRSRGHAPYDDPSVEMWTIARGAYLPPRVDLLFELHVPALWDGWGNLEATKLYADMLREFKTPIMMQQKYPDIPTAVALPKDDILKVVTPYDLGAEAPYQTSQVSWMCAYAIQQLYDPMKHMEYLWAKVNGDTPEPIGEIMFYGIDLISEGESRSYQRHCLEYYIGMTRGMGIRLTVAEESTLVKHMVDGVSKMYAYDYPLSRSEAVHVYGHPMRQQIRDKDGKIVDIREVPGLLGMPMVDKKGSNKFVVVGNIPEQYRLMEERAEAKQGLTDTPQPEPKTMAIEQASTKQ